MSNKLNLLRAEIQSNSPLGQQAQALMSEGQLVPDDIVIGMIRNKLNAHNKAAIWQLPAWGALGVLVIFLIFFRDPVKAKA